MDMIALTKLISDLSLYFAATGFIMRFVSTTAYNDGLISVASRSGGVFLQFILLIISGMCSYALRNKKALRFLPLLIFVPVFLISRNPIDSLWVAFPCLLVAVNTVRKRFGCDRKRFMDSWKWMLGISAACVFLYLFIPYTDGGAGENGAPIFFLLYAASSVVLMRCLRQPEDVLRDKRFRITNISLVLSVGIAGFALSIVSRALSLDVSHISAFLYKIGYALDTGFKEFRVNNLPSLRCSDIYMPSDPGSRPSDGVFLDPQGHIVVNGIPTGVMIAMLAAVAALFVIAGVLLFRRKNARRAVSTRQTESEGGKGKAAARKADQPYETLSNRNAVRKLYRKFLNVCRKKKISINSYDTTLDIRNSAENAFPKDALDNIRAVYAVSRYDGATPVSDADVKAARNAYIAIKRNGT